MEQALELAQSRQGLRALITGASKGIGLAVARALRPYCSEISLVASSEGSFDNVREEFGDKTRFYAADFSNSDALRHLAADIAEKNHQLDVIVNNCGVYEEGPFRAASLLSLERMLDINTKAPITLIKLLLDQIERGTSPIVINISSIQAATKDDNLAVYAASKAALSAFSDALRKELNLRGIRVSVLQLSGVNTWNDPAPKDLLEPEQVATVVRDIVTAENNVQIQEITLSGLTPR